MQEWRRSHTENVLQGFTSDTSGKHCWKGWTWAHPRGLGRLDRLLQPFELQTCIISTNKAAEGGDKLCNVDGTGHGWDTDRAPNEKGDR